MPGNGAAAAACVAAADAVYCCPTTNLWWIRDSRWEWSGAIVLLEFPMHPINSTRTEFETKYDAKSQFNFKSEVDNIKVDIFAI